MRSFRRAGKASRSSLQSGRRCASGTWGSLCQLPNSQLPTPNSRWRPSGNLRVSWELGVWKLGIDVTNTSELDSRKPPDATPSRDDAWPWRPGSGRHQVGAGEHDEPVGAHRGQRRQRPPGAEVDSAVGVVEFDDHLRRAASSVSLLACTDSRFSAGEDVDGPATSSMSCRNRCRRSRTDSATCRARAEHRRVRGRGRRRPRADFRQIASIAAATSLARAAVAVRSPSARIVEVTSASPPCFAPCV